MKITLLTILAAALLFFPQDGDAGEKVTLVAESTSPAYGYSVPITLEKGDSATLTFISGTFAKIVTVISGIEYELANGSVRRG